MRPGLVTHGRALFPSGVRSGATWCIIIRPGGAWTQDRVDVSLHAGTPQRISERSRIVVSTLMSRCRCLPACPSSTSASLVVNRWARQRADAGACCLPSLSLCSLIPAVSRTTHTPRISLTAIPPLSYPTVSLYLFLAQRLRWLEQSSGLSGGAFQISREAYRQ